MGGGCVHQSEYGLCRMLRRGWVVLVKMLRRGRKGMQVTGSEVACEYHGHQQSMNCRVRCLNLLWYYYDGVILVSI